MTSSTEELDLLERVFLRIGSAESDEQLEATINKFLIPVLLKLSSANEGVRKKVMELLVHLNKRIRRRPEVQLPVEALLAHYMDPNASSFLINFSILYIKLGYPRLPPEKQEELAPTLLQASGRKPKVHQDSLLLLLTSVVGRLKVANDIHKRREVFKLDEQPELMKNFCSFMLDVLLAPYVHISSPPDESSSSGSQTFHPPPGMSEYGYKRVTAGESPMTPERLEQTKLGILRFLSTGMLSEDEIICHFIIAASDTRFTVANFADNELRRISGSVDWSNTTVANRLYLIYLGTPEVPPEKSNLIPVANRVAPANTRIRLKILPYLGRLEKDAILFPASINVIFNTLSDKTSNGKIQLLALNFALAIVKRGEEEILNKMGALLYTGLLKMVWNNEYSSQIRVAGYTIIGQIVKRLPRIINKNLLELHVFFENLSCEQTDIKMAVRDSLLTMIDAFQLLLRTPDDSNESNTQQTESDSKEASGSKGKGKKTEPVDRESMMLEFLSSQVESKEAMARFVAVKYLVAVFPTNHVQSRYLLLLAVSDSNFDTSSFAQRALYSDLENEVTDDRFIPLPDFAKMSEYIYNKAENRATNSKQRVYLQRFISPFAEASFNEILIYLRLCLAQSASVELTNTDLMNHPCEHSPAIREYILETHEKNPKIFNNYLSMIERLFIPSAFMNEIGSMIEVVGACPELFAKKFVRKFDLFLEIMGHAKEKLREDVSLFLSIMILSTMDEAKQDEMVKHLLTKVKDRSVETQHGAILTLGHYVEGKVTQLARKGLQYDPEAWPLHKEIIVEIAKFFENPSTILVTGACIALGNIMKCAPIPLPDEAPEGLSKRVLMEKFLEVGNMNKLSLKIKEKILLACGKMTLGENFPFAKDIVKNLMELSRKTKDIDVHFCISEAIILCIEGKSSAEKRDMWRVKESDYERPAMPLENLNLLNSVIDELIANILNPQPNVRQFTSVYLLSIVKKLYFIQDVVDRLPEIQPVFMELLSDSNEMVQDIASKGLAMVYEYSSPDKKKGLVKELLEQIITGRRTIPVSKDAKSQEENAYGTSSSSGGNISTYKELCNFASELNQPDLIYKFMHLAYNNAVWNTKNAAALGFHAIILQTKDELNEYLPKVVPRLYRYQFDPTPKIQQSMVNIWRALVKEPHKALNIYYNEILDELITNLTSPHWRVRISCVSALADFFRGSRSILDAREKLPDMWNSLFRVMDDVHEGTRLAAQSTAKVLASICVRACDISEEDPDEEGLQVVLSIFMTGASNNLSEVRALSLLTISQLVHVVGPSLKPNLTTVIIALLEAAGEIEPVGLSYLSTRYGDRCQTQDMIDSVRASISKTHHTTQTVTKCIQYIELEMMDALVPKVIEIMKSVKLGSKIAAAHLVVLLTHQLGRAIEPYTGKFMAVLVNGLLDKNTTVRRTFASSIGQILHVAKASSLEKLFNKLFTWYFEKEDLHIRGAIGFTLQSAAQYNGELLKDHFPVILPLVFFAMHTPKVEGDDNSNVVVWDEVWNDISLGYETSIKKYIDGILKCLDQNLSSSSWTMKSQAGRCIQTIATKVGDSLDSNDRDKLIGMSLKALPGKTFKGKEDIIKGIAKLCMKSGPDLKKNSELCQSVVEALLKECGKSDVVYRRQSVEALGTVLEAFDTMDFFQKVFELYRNICQKLEEKSDERDDPEDVNSRRGERFQTMSALYVCLGKSWPTNKETQLKYQDELLSDCCDALQQNPRDVQASILIALRFYIENLHYFNPENKATEDEEKHLTDIMEKVCISLHHSLGVPRNIRIRKEALNVVFTLANKLRSSGRDAEVKILYESLKDRIQELEKDNTPEVRTRLADVKEVFKRATKEVLNPSTNALK